MTDAAIAAFGCVVTFIAAGGFYVFIQSRYDDGPERIADPIPTKNPQPEPVRVRQG